MKKYICPFCKKELDRCGIHHIYACKENKEITNKDEIKLQYIRFNFGNDIDKNIIEDYKNLYSLPMLKEKYDIDYKSILFILNLNHIEIRNSSESAKKISVKKHKDTCLKKYGVENVSQTDEIKKKKEQTFLEHYGVDNIWKLSGYNKKCRELYPEVYEELMMKFHQGRDKYFKNITPEEKVRREQKRYDTEVKNGRFQSKLEIRICKIFEELNFSYTRQFHIKGYSHPYDFHLCDSKILIEVNGDYWHANPKIYDENHSVRGLTSKQIWERDKKHIERAVKDNYIVISIWEDEMNCRNDEELKEYILELLNNI